MKKCCICGKPFTGYGNNPAPVETRGECCDVCNVEVVIPRRLLDAKKARIRATADALVSTPLQRAESAQLNALIGKIVEIEFTDGDVEVGILHKDTPAIKYQNPDGDDLTICGYYLERPNKGELHFKKSHVKAIRPTYTYEEYDTIEKLNNLCEKSVLIKFTDGTDAAGFLHKQTIFSGGKPRFDIFFVNTPIGCIRIRLSTVTSVEEA